MSGSSPRPAPTWRRRAERAQILEALGETGWNISRTAARLGISRNTLRYRMEKYGLRPGATAPPERVAPAATPIAPAPPAAPVTPAPGIRWERRRLTHL